MSHRHFILDHLANSGGLSAVGEADLYLAVDQIVDEHRMGDPSIEERAARAEAIAIINHELIRRIGERDHD